MNYLVHLYLSDPDPLCRLGNMMGDFVKGRLEGLDLPADLLRGLRQHRAVDRLSMAHPAVRRSKARLNDCFGHTKGILVDIFYDHFLAKNWSQWNRGRLADFAAEAYDLLGRHQDLLSQTFRPVARGMVRHDWLTAYRDPGNIRFVLGRMALRLRRPNHLAQGYKELELCGAEMASDCRVFITEAKALLGQPGVVRG